MSKILILTPEIEKTLFDALDAQRMTEEIVSAAQVIFDAPDANEVTRPLETALFRATLANPHFESGEGLSTLNAGIAALRKLRPKTYLTPAKEHLERSHPSFQKLQKLQKLQKRTADITL